MLNDEIIRVRTQARAAAAAVAELANGEVLSLPPEVREIFWEELRQRAFPNYPAASATPAVRAPAEPFTDAQAKAWGSSRIQFGIHRGKRIDEIPISYLEKLVDPNDFTRHLRRYLASHRVALEQEMAEQNS
jgi:hypothetical protein